MSEKTVNVANHKCRAIINQGSGVPIVFFHGLSYTSEVWRRLSITGLLMEKKLPFLALDMPYGVKSECQPKTHDINVNVAFANAAVKNFLGDAVPVLVGASLGAHVALNYAARFPVKSLLLVAPVRALEPHLVQAYRNFTFPVRIIVGSEDRVVAHEELRELAAKLPNAKLVEYEGAKHSAYVDFPDKFKRSLMELYALSEQT